ncbi:cation transporter [Prosthecochloris sp. SCSIO W1103]|nr:cation transporter [Prosthecochloris sp. SCSIO W1103]
MALGQTWYFERRSNETGNFRYTYGYRHFSLLRAIISTVILFGSSFYSILEALPRIVSPEKPDAQGMTLLAVFGIVVNGISMADTPYFPFILKSTQTLPQRNTAG